MTVYRSIISKFDKLIDFFLIVIKICSIYWYYKKWASQETILITFFCFFITWRIFTCPCIYAKLTAQVTKLMPTLKGKSFAMFFIKNVMWLNIRCWRQFYNFSSGIYFHIVETKIVKKWFCNVKLIKSYFNLNIMDFLLLFFFSF
jgi:hypothetical protein